MQSPRALGSAKHPRSFVGGHGEYSRMRQFAFGGDGIKLLPTFIRSTNRSQIKTINRFLHHDGRHCHEAQSMVGENIDEGRVVEFPDQSWPDADRVKPFLQRTTQTA